MQTPSGEGEAGEQALVMPLLSAAQVKRFMRERDAELFLVVLQKLDDPEAAVDSACASIHAAGEAPPAIKAGAVAV